ncbi:hypothetical protein FACS189493_6550 [Spirochaetia bacterium]|nr:hypothetical protein FACS189493_6550 [Spirochaetia bacterium]
MANFEEKMTYDDFIADWEYARPEYKPFCFDGVLIDEYWDKASPKIMFLLKETYGDFDEIRGCEFAGSGGSNTIFRRMRMWTFIIDEVINGRNPSYENTLKIKEAKNNSIAWVNLKKKVENQVYSNDYDILKYVDRDCEWLNDQISNYVKPNIILCGGTFKYCNKLFSNIVPIVDRLYKVNNMFLIDFYHPSRRGGYEKDYDELLSIVKNITKNNM